MAFFLFIAILLCATDSLWAGEICCPGLGCYNNNPPYDGLLIPLPDCPDSMGIDMRVYTRQNPTSGEIITRDIIPPAFKKNVMTIFIVHGWQQLPLIGWMHDIKEAVLEQGDFNVIIVDWTPGARNVLYAQPASNTRTVGGEIALVSNNTINKGYSSKALMYCVGHSLGSHVCGHAGKQGQFGRITGLDPAGPLFEGRDISAGLNPASADLVDNIHTNGGTLTSIGAGTLRALGHVDFYVNKGTTQPGCVFNLALGFSVLGTSISLKDLIINCNHVRAIDYYTESIRTPCFLSRQKCSNQYNLPGSCTESSEPVQSMGYHANTYPGRGIFYLETNSAEPYCRG